MKNLFKFVYIIALVISGFAFGQDYINKNADELLTSTNESARKRIKILCTTYSCCGLGDFGIEIWSHKECSYIEAGKSTISVISIKNNDGSDFSQNEIEIKNDITLIDKDNSLETEGLELVMKAGLYKVIDGQIAFEPVAQRIRIKKVCYVETHQGQIFGHEYSWTSSWCVYYPSFEDHQAKNINGGYAVIDLSKNDTLIELAKRNDNVLQFDEDIILKDQYVLRAGKYFVDEGKIYTRNIHLK